MNKFRRPRGLFRSKPFSHRESRQRRRTPASRTKAIFLLIVLVLGGFMIRSLFFSGEKVSAEATIEIRRGILEFSLDGEELWTRGNSGQTFLEGDRIRCMGNGETSIQLLDGGSVLVLAPNTEISFTKLRQKASGEKNISIQVTQGTLWGMVADNEFSEKGSRFLLTTSSSEIDTKGGIFNLTTGNEDLIRVLLGKLELRTKLPNDKMSDPLSISIGQQFLVDESAKELFVINDAAKALESLDSSFEESEWNLGNLARFRPQEAAGIRHRIEKNTSPVAQDPSKNGLDSPVIQLPLEGAIIPASQDTLELEGTAPADAYRISVNGYVLTKFQPGDRKWSYFASRKFGTLVPGINKFEVVSVSRDGRESTPATVSVTYNAGSAPLVVAEAGTDFPVPIVQHPALSDATQPFETTESVITFSGIVDPATIAVEVNGFRLTKFQPGNTEWKYTANAGYGNMVTGENIYTIVAIGPENKQSSTVLRVNYTPQ